VPYWDNFHGILFYFIIYRGSPFSIKQSSDSLQTVPVIHIISHIFGSASRRETNVHNFVWQLDSARKD